MEESMLQKWAMRWHQNVQCWMFIALLALFGQPISLGGHLGYVTNHVERQLGHLVQLTCGENISIH